MANERKPFADVKDGDIVYEDVAARRRHTPIIVGLVALVLVVVAIVVIPQFMGTSATPTASNAPQGMAPVTSTDSKPQISIALVVDGSDADRGVMFDGTVSIAEGGNVYDALKASSLNVESRQALGMGAYVSAIQGLAEKSAGPTSGWLFYVNDKLSSQSSDKVALQNGDSVRWVWRVDATSVRS